MRIIYINFFLAFIYFGNAQSAYSLVKKGNKQLEQENYSEAEILYRKSLDKSSNEVVPLYNIGVSQYNSGNIEQAKQQFTTSAENFSTKEDKAHSFHNLGNCLLSEKKYKESIDAYKNALKLVPNDMDTKYNLAYAQLMLKKEQEQQQQNQDKKDDNKENDKEDNKDQDQQDKKEESEKDDKGEPDENKDGEKDEKPKDGEQDEKKDQDKQDGEDDKNTDKGDEEKGQPAQPKELKLTKEQADKLLKALENEEGKLQEKLDKPEGEPVRVIIEKDW